jgi:hypothetical protein
MTSAFTPVDRKKFPKTLKVTMSMQDWCGQVWMQSNLRKEGYQVNNYSYFESEGDEKYTIDNGFIESDFWMQIRINPGEIKTGRLKVIPPQAVTRMLHIDYKAYDAEVTLADYKGKDMPGEGLKSLEINYSELGRQMQIVFESKFPYTITGWKENRVSGFGNGAKKMATVATLTNQIIEPYWGMNSNSDEGKREELGLD